ncbi:P-loop NTPase, partial [Sphingomonas sp.]|uniref:P-loop NTPase n=1 Tax=Sphingomonas sp. TaxID=28214 RepID=UPI001D7BA67D
CGAVSDPFGQGGAQAAAAALNIPFLGAIPLDITIRTASDAGTPPVTLAEGEGAGPAAFSAIAAQVNAWLAL